MKFGQFVEYNMRNNFLEKSCTKIDEKARAIPFLKKSKLNISLDQHSGILYGLFLFYVQVDDF